MNNITTAINIIVIRISCRDDDAAIAVALALGVEGTYIFVFVVDINDAVVPPLVDVFLFDW
ncbi:hypothetical protein BLA29_012626, partial [Euroglyphus maynei]